MDSPMATEFLGTPLVAHGSGNELAKFHVEAIQDWSRLSMLEWRITWAPRQPCSGFSKGRRQKSVSFRRHRWPAILHKGRHRTRYAAKWEIKRERELIKAANQLRTLRVTPRGGMSIRPRRDPRSDHRCARRLQNLGEAPGRMIPQPLGTAYRVLTYFRFTPSSDAMIGELSFMRNLVIWPQVSRFASV